MGLYEDLAVRGKHIDLILGLVVDGAPYVFVERPIPSTFAILTNRAQVVAVKTVKEGESKLDLEIRREVSATVDFDLIGNEDGSLDQILSVNRRRTAWITAGFAASATTLVMTSTAGMVAGDTIYIGAESVRVGVVASATTLTGCTRGYLGTTAVELFGTASDGDPVYRYVPSWEGRRAWLYAWTVDQGVALSQQILSTLIIDEPPRYDGAYAWSIRCAGVMQEYMERAVGVGLREANITGTPTISPSSITLPVDDATAFAVGSTPAYVALSTGQVRELLSVGATSITISRERFQQRFGVPSPIRAESVRQIGIVGGASAYPLMWALRSKYGSGVGFDVFPGVAPANEFDFGWRLGAGLDDADVDSTSFIARTTFPHTIVIDEEKPVGDLIQEWCMLSSSAVVVTSDGQLKAISISNPRSTTSVIIGKANLVPDSGIDVVANESVITPLATVECDYSPLSKDTRATFNLIDVDTLKRYPRSPRRREIALPSVGSKDAARLVRDDAWAHPSEASTGDIQNLAYDIVGGEGPLARIEVSITVTLDLLSLRLGDVTQIGSDLPDGFNAPDMAGGTIAGKYARVISRRPDYDRGVVGLTLQLLEPLVHVCPAAVIASAVGAVLTLSTTGPEVRTTSPGNDFGIGMSVRVYDVSAGLYERIAITNLTTTTITLASAPTFVIQAGIDYVAVDHSLSNAATSSVSGYTVAEMCPLTDETGVSFGGISTFNPRWR
jgi:hypothetical protein